MKLYKGNALRTKSDIKERELDVETYLPSIDLVKAVNMAQILKRPLLVKGEPGCGKSRLAEAIAAELFGKEFRNYYFEWNVKSASKAQDGLYTINNLQRLSDANIKYQEGDKPDLDIKLHIDENGQTKGNYIELGYLGKAFIMSNQKGLIAPPVVLIDEIDKADIDFPNDLLLELDRMEFQIPEISINGKPLVISANKDMRPLFIITSNDEKPLPAAFLRRCLFHYIDFKEIALTDIVRSKFPMLEPMLVEESVGAFKSWREKIANKGTTNKNISTSELLDWIRLIDHYVKPGENLALDHDVRPPYYQALLKDVESIQLFAKEEVSTAV
ncbi:AAA family ATPase [Niastella sp. OAS944]|uniref:AAA family ATPase n=1 Tax=Niastella sp. OAS944 TaxID=2664089 RepID=UPI0035C83F18|nr:MoxR-like ATPase [Chitinophagaceae bacterium OAS944]